MSDNELIALFMGAKTHEDVYDYSSYDSSPAHSYHKSPIDHKYGTSWDALMPVVEKIRKVVLPELHKSMPRNSASKGDLIDVDISCGFMEVDIRIVYKHVVEFIKWYNTQSKQSASSNSAHSYTEGSDL